jgi:hypothetical protein
MRRTDKVGELCGVTEEEDGCESLLAVSVKIHAAGNSDEGGHLDHLMAGHGVDDGAGDELTRVVTDKVPIDVISMRSNKSALEWRPPLPL